MAISVFCCLSDRSVNAFFPFSVLDHSFPGQRAVVVVSLLLIPKRFRRNRRKEKEKKKSLRRRRRRGRRVPAKKTSILSIKF